MLDFPNIEATATHFNVSRETSEKLKIYEDLLAKWNESINLVSKSTLESAAKRHFADSMQLWELRKAFDVWVDIGSGAGFPGMVLAIMAEGQGDFHLVESDARKCAFLRNVSRETNIPVTVHTKRIESFDGVKADIVSARALASVDALFSYTENFLRKDGICLYLKGQTCESELEEASRSWTYEAEQFASKTDENGTVLRIKDIARVG